MLRVSYLYCITRYFILQGTQRSSRVRYEHITRVVVRKEKNMDKWQTTKEIADYLGKSPSWLNQLAKDYGIPRVKIGRHWRYRKQDIDQWLYGKSNLEKAR